MQTNNRKNPEYESLNMELNRQLFSGWEIQSSETVKDSGKSISADSNKNYDWYKADAHCTVLDVLIKNNVYKNPFFGTNLQDIDEKPFQNSWWYKTSFVLDELEEIPAAVLAFDGINYRANIWLNGNLVADSNLVEGTFCRFKFEVSKFLISGKNILAVEVFPPRPGEFSTGFVDWNPAPPDRNMGIFRPVKLNIVDRVKIENPFIQTNLDCVRYDHADLKISAELVNYTDHDITGRLRGQFEEILFEKDITLSANSQKQVKFTVEEFTQLRIAKPRVWWPNNFGEANLYLLDLEFETELTVTDRISQVFGIRTIEDYLNEEGHRGFKINGKDILIKGAGWTDELFLSDTAESIEAQIRYVKHMNLNCIRLEGFWGKDHKLYDLCDRHGILIMAGWSCHWEHEMYLGKPIHPRYGGVTEPDEIDLIARSWQDQVTWLRNHPSIFVWSVASDMVPHPDLEKRYFETFKDYDLTRPYLNSTGGVGSDQGIITEVEIISDLSGSSGVKMLGPYDYTPPVYWYTNKHLGGAYGFNTETCPGGNVPPLESVKKMIPENKLWPLNDVWNHHCARNEFSTMDIFNESLEKRYGSARNVKDFCRKAQLLNYELMRPMFEAFATNKGLATGIIQWMLNSAWPAMYWQLYDYYLMPNAAFYGTKKACEPLHLLYNYGDKQIYFINETFNPLKNHHAAIRVFDIHSKKVFEKDIKLNADPESSHPILILADFPDISTTYFLDLRLFNADKEEIANNFYWLSRKADILDYDYVFADFAFYTPSKEFADFTQLMSMEKATINKNYSFELTGDKYIAIVTLENSSEQIAFFIELSIVNNRTKHTVLPVIWEDNYISLLPGEKRQITATFNKNNLNGALPELAISGWNL